MGRARLDEQHQKHIDAFKNDKGTDFDKDFTKHQVTGYTQASKQAKNKDMKDFATKTRP